MNELLSDPLSRPEDLGKPIPRWPHATSVCLPTWGDNIDYEKWDSRVISKLSCGYPRFVYHPYVKTLFGECEERFAKKGEQCVAFPSRRTAEACRKFLKANGSNSSLHEIGNDRIHCICFPEAMAKIVACFWQHSGEGISSRQASVIVERRRLVSNGKRSKLAIRKRIAEYVQCSPDHVFLFPSGMSAIYNVFLVLAALSPDRKSVQFGFPYVDTLKVQQKFGQGVHFFPKGDEMDLQQLSERLAKEKAIGIFGEFPMNPLMRSPNLDQLTNIARENQCPVIIDDTISTFYNCQVIPPADVLVTSLTKFFSGVGDVMGGAVVIKPESELSSLILDRLRRDYEDNLWSEDADALETNSRDFANRMAKINATTETLCDYLHSHPQVEKLYYPKFATQDNYNSFKKSTGGYSGVFSIVLKKRATNTAKFFDSLKISKGPSLGTTFSLACPYTILAHYHEMDFVELCGVSRHLIRISVGLEEPEILLSRFEHALVACE